MENRNSEKSMHNYYQTIVEELAKLSDKELFSYYLTSSDKSVVQTILEYKEKGCIKIPKAIIK